MEEILASLDAVSEQYMIQNDENGLPLIEKYSQTFIYALVQKHIFDLEAIFTENPKQTIDIFDFVYHMLKFTNQPNDETMYVIVQLIDFFKSICDESQDASTLKFHDVSNYICKYNPKIEEDDQFSAEGKIIPTLHLPIAKNFKSVTDLKSRRVREIDINPPLVVGGLGQDLVRVNKEKIYIDSSKSSNSMITRVQFSPELVQIFALHQYSDHVQMYHPDCTSSKILRPHTPQLRNTIILDIYWSEKQQRLGASFKDQWLCFWDANDFSYEKVFSTIVGSNIATDQIKIYYLNQVDRWITVDYDSRVHFWNLEIEQVQHTINCHEFEEGGILEIFEVDYLSLTCLAGINFLTLWDMTAPKMLFKVAVHHSRLHSVIFFKTYQMIITCGYDSKINLYQLHKKYNDSDLMGKLEGHTSLVTAIQAIENTPMLVTSDDKHIIKIWDIRTLKCVQTFDLELRQTICKIVILTDIQAICLVTSRLLVIEMENCVKSMPHYKYLRQANDEKLSQNYSDKQAIPIKIELDCIKRRILVCTKKDVRYIDLTIGRCLKIIKGIILDHDDEITQFRTLQQNKKFLVGTQKGALKLYECDTGELVQAFQAHFNEVTSLMIDYSTQIVTTTSFDSQIHIWKELVGRQDSSIKQREFKFEKIREIKNAHFNNPIILTEFSIYHNLLVTATNSPQIMIWNFEFGQLVASLELEDEAEPTALTFINGYSCLVIASNKGQIIIVNLLTTEESVDINYISNVEQSENIQNDYYTKLIIDLRTVGTKKEESNKRDEDISNLEQVYCLMIASNQKGCLKQYDLSPIFQEGNLQFLPHCNTRINFNPYRQNKEDFLTVVNTHKINHWAISGENVVRNHSYVERQFPIQNRSNRKKSKLITRTKTTLQRQDFAKVNEVKAHKDQLTHLSFIQFEGENLLADSGRSVKVLSASFDGYVKIWSINFELLCSLNINHPLPTQWNVQIDEKEVIKFKIAFGIKVIQFIRKNCLSQMSVSQARMFDPFNIFKSLMNAIKITRSQLKQNINTKAIRRVALSQNDDEEKKKQVVKSQDRKSLKKNKRISQANQPILERKDIQKINYLNEGKEVKKIQLLVEEFSPRDIQFEKIKHIYRREIEGPSLKQFEELKKVYNFGQMWKKQQSDQLKNMDKQKRGQNQNDERQKELKDIIQYLHPRYKLRFQMDEPDQEQKQGFVEQLEKRFDQINSIQASQNQSRSRAQKRITFLNQNEESEREVNLNVESQNTTLKQQDVLFDTFSSPSKKRSLGMMTTRELGALAELSDLDTYKTSSLPKISMKSVITSRNRDISNSNTNSNTHANTHLRSKSKVSKAEIKSFDVSKIKELIKTSRRRFF